jgi:hypothetical protein
MLRSVCDPAEPPSDGRLKGGSVSIGSTHRQRTRQKVDKLFAEVRRSRMKRAKNHAFFALRQQGPQRWGRTDALCRNAARFGARAALSQMPSERVALATCSQTPSERAARVTCSKCQVKGRRRLLHAKRQVKVRRSRLQPLRDCANAADTFVRTPVDSQRASASDRAPGNSLRRA